MIHQCKEQGFKIPVWKVKDKSVRVTFPDVSVPFNYNEGISEGTSKGITNSLKVSMLEIIELLIKNESLRASELADKLNKPYKTIERHIKTLRDIGAITYEGSKRAGGYKINKELLSNGQQRTIKRINKNKKIEKRGCKAFIGKHGIDVAGKEPVTINEEGKQNSSSRQILDSVLDIFRRLFR